MFAILFYSWLIVVDLRRDPTLGLTDELSAFFEFRLISILKDEFRSLPTQHIRANHTSLNKLGILIKREWEVDLDQNTCELGWKFETCDELGEAYYTITTEGTLHNALSVMHNSIRTTNSPAIMRLSLWSPIPSDPPFAPSRRAAEVARRRPKATASTSGASARSHPATANQLVEADVELRDNSRLPTPEQIVYTPPAAPIQFVLPPALPATELNKQHDVLPVIQDQLRTSRQQLRQEEEREEEERQEEER